MTKPIPAELTGGHGPARNAMFSLIGQVVSAVFTTVLTLFLLRKLGPENYGVLALAVSAGTIALLISDFGIPSSAARFAAEDPRNRVRAAAILRTALGLKVIASVVMTIGLVVLAPVIADAYDTPELTLPLRLIAIAVAAQSIGGLFLSWFIGLGRISLNLRYAVVESSIETGASIGLVLLGGGAAGAVGGRAIGFGVAAVFAAILAVRLVGVPALKESKKQRFPSRPIARYGAVLVVTNGAFAILDRIDVLIIGAFLGTAPAGLFEAAVRILTFLQYPGIAVGAGFGPRLAKSENSVPDVQTFKQSLRYTILAYLLIAAPTLVWAEPIVRLLLGDAYAQSASALQALTPAVVLMGIGQVLATGVDYLGEARRRIPVAISALVVNVAIDLILVPRIGITAGAVGSGVALAIYVGGHLRICHQALDVSFVDLLPTALRGLLGLASASLVLLALGTGESLSPWAWVVGPLLASVAYLTTLWLSREVSATELRRLLSHPARLLRRG